MTLKNKYFSVSLTALSVNFPEIKSLNRILEEIIKILPIVKIFCVLLPNLMVHLTITFKTSKCPRFLGTCAERLLKSNFNICSPCFYECIKTSSDISRSQTWQEVLTAEKLHFSKFKRIAIFLKSIHKQRETPLVRKNEQKDHFPTR